MRNFNPLIILIMVSSALFIACHSDDDTTQNPNGNPDEITPEYAGADLSSHAKIERDSASKEATLKVFQNEAWELYDGSNIDDIDPDNFQFSGDGQGEFNLDVDPQQRYIFLYKTPQGQSLMAENRLPMEGAYNFRDLGGIKTKDDKYVKWGALFRSDEMDKLTDADLTYLASTDLKTIIDFRTQKEKKGSLLGETRDRLPSTVTDTIDLSIDTKGLSESAIARNILGGGSKEELEVNAREAYVEMVSDSAIVSVFKKFFKQIQAPDNLPLSYHCSAGKDRTGVATMLILSALDVDRETIMENYLKSNDYIKAKYSKYYPAIPKLEPLVTVNKDFLDIVFAKIDEKYGSMDHFLTEVLGVDKAKMKEIYLY